MFSGDALIVGGWGVVGWGRKSYLGLAEIGSFSSRDLGLSNTHDIFWHFVSTGYFYILFLWTIAVSDFPPLEIYENSGSPLSSITFTVNSHEDNLSINILFQTLYSIKLVFLLKYTLRFLISKFDLNVKRRPYVF